MCAFKWGPPPPPPGPTSQLALPWLRPSGSSVDERWEAVLPGTVWWHFSPEFSGIWTDSCPSFSFLLPWFCPHFSLSHYVCHGPGNKPFISPFWDARMIPT